MKRLYLSQDGIVRAPAPGEHGHLDMGRKILGPGWRGDVESTYAGMWNAGWVRVVDSPDTLVGEQWVDGQPVAFASLPRVQQEWLLSHSVQAGKQLVWNARPFTTRREGQPEARPDLPAQVGRSLSSRVAQDGGESPPRVNDCAPITRRAS